MYIMQGKILDSGLTSGKKSGYAGKGIKTINKM